MDIKTWISLHSPAPVRTLLQRVYYGVSSKQHPERIRSEWKESFAEYARMSEEFVTTAEYRGVVSALEALSNDGMIGVDAMTDLYVLVRERQPGVVVETGVCNGASTFAILSALEQNERGELHSIDLPFYSDVPMERRREQTHPELGRADIPSDKEPGWLVPNRLRKRWEFYEGKSQRLLPAVISDHPPDIFIHDSEHSHPAMMFELEIAWHAMESGLIICDDITWNDAFEVFTDVRANEYGQISPTSGYIEVS